MPRYIAFLRAINVGGRPVKMDSLRRHFKSLGLSDVTTFGASGNVMFETAAKGARALERKIANKLRKALGSETAVFIRTDRQVAKIAKYKPFRGSAIGAAAELSIVFLSHAPGDKLRRKVTALRTDTDQFHVHGREIYWLRRRKRGKLTYSTVPLEKTLGRAFTVRSIRPVRKLAAKFSAFSMTEARGAAGITESKT